MYFTVRSVVPNPSSASPVVPSLQNGCSGPPAGPAPEPPEPNGAAAPEEPLPAG